MAAGRGRGTTADTGTDEGYRRADLRLAVAQQVQIALPREHPSGVYLRRWRHGACMRARARARAAAARGQHDAGALAGTWRLVLSRGLARDDAASRRHTAGCSRSPSPPARWPIPTPQGSRPSNHRDSERRAAAACVRARPHSSVANKPNASTKARHETRARVRVRERRWP